jgi:hypothetical protein
LQQHAVFLHSGIRKSIQSAEPLRILENAQVMAAHENQRTTKLYDRTGDEITLDEVERIGI